MASKPFFASDEAQLFRRGRFDIDAVDADLQIGRDVLAHRLPMLAETGRFSQHGRVHVDGVLSAFRGALLNMTNETPADVTFPTRIGIREVHSDIAEPQGTQDCIA